MYKLVKRILIVFMIMFMNLLLINIHEVNGEEKEVDVNISNFKITNANGNEIDKIYYTDTFYIKMDWDASSHGTNLHEGDYFYVELPDSMRFPSDVTSQNFPLLNEEGITIATATVLPGDNDIGGRIKVTFTDNVEGKYNVKGDLFLSAKFNREIIIFDEVNTFSMIVNTNVITDDIYITGPKVVENETLAKWVGRVDGDNNKAFWHVRINHKGDVMNNVIVFDELEGSNEVFLPETFYFERVIFDEYANVTTVLERIDITDKIVFENNNRKFTLNIGDIDKEGYRLEYQSTYTPNTTLSNHVRLQSNNGNYYVKRDYVFAEAGGSAGGDIANRIKIIKVDSKDNNIRLANASFEVKDNEGNTFILTTDANGEVTSDILKQGKYIVREISSPTGYILSDEEYELDVNSNGVIKTISNDRDVIEIPVEKKWEGIYLREVIIHLMADGIDTGKTITLNNNNNWKDSFKDLDKIDEIDGHTIMYSIYEDNYYGYRPNIVNNDNSFIITNVMETIDIPIQKKWLGPIALEEKPVPGEFILASSNTGPITIYITLLRDDVPIASDILSIDNNWTSSFNGLPKKDPYTGREYVYTVREENIPEGYKVEIDGNQNDGYIIKNISQEKINIPVTKKWVGSKPNNNESLYITIGLYQDNKEYQKGILIYSENNYTYRFLDLPKYREDGSLYEYSVKELNVLNDYSVSISGNINEGFIITNTKKSNPPTPKTPKISVPNTSSR